jgi:nicotinate dehydrogenase subunit A
MPNVVLRVNGQDRTVAVDDPTMPLLYALRDSLALNGPKFGCGLGQCGACTAMVDGEAVRTCQTAAVDAVGRDITTLEGLGSPDRMHPLQAAFVEEQAAQCGYCSNGMIMTSAALLRRNPRPSEDEIRSALAGNLCRCGTQPRVIRAVQRAASRGGR